MLIRGLSIEEIARLLRRDHGDVQDIVVEIGRARREGSSAPAWNRRTNSLASPFKEGACGDSHSLISNRDVRP